MNDLSRAETSDANQHALPGAQQQARDLLAAQKLLRATMDSSLDMIQVFEAVRNSQGDIIDFIWRLNNHAAQKIYGDVVGKSLLEHQPGVVEEGIFDAFKLVVEIGQPQHYEKHYVHEQFDGWFHQSVVKLNDGVATTTADITGRKKAEQQIQQSQAFLQSIIDSSLDVIQVFKAVRDEAGQILDFVWVMNNQRAVAQNGQVIGKSLLELNPGVVPTGIFDHMVEVPQTGVAYEQEQYYPHEQFDGWFYQALVKTDDGVTMNTRDISRQKQAEGDVLRLKDEVAQKATDKYQTLVKAIYQGFALCELIRDQKGQGVDYRVLELNPAFERQTGLSLHTMKGRTAREAFPTLEWWWTETYTALVDSGVPTTFEKYFPELGRWYEIGAYPMQGDQFAVLYNDITDRKRAQERQAFLLRLSDDFRAESDPEAIGTLATRLVADYLHLDRCYIAQFSREQEQGWIGPEYHAPDLPPLSGEYRFADFPEGMKRIETGPLIIRDLFNDPSLSETDKLSMDQALGIQGMLTAVLRQGERNYFWCLTAAMARPRNWTEAELTLLKDVAERTWAAMERARTEEALRIREEEYRSLFNTIEEGLAMLGVIRDDNGKLVDLTYLETNPAFEKQTGLATSVIIGKLFTQVLPKEDMDRWVPLYAHVMASGEPSISEEYVAFIDRWFMVSVYPRSDDKLAVFYRDITQRKLQEQQQHYLLQLNDALRPVADPVAIQQVALKILSEHLGLMTLIYDLILSELLPTA